MMRDKVSPDEWWLRTQKKVKKHVRRRLCILDDKDVDLCSWPFIPFTDGTQLDTTRRSKSKAGLIGFGNFKNGILRRPFSRELFAVFPDLQTSAAETKAIAVVRSRRKVYYQCMNVALASIKSCYAEGGRLIHCKDGKTRRIVPVIPFIACDGQEACLITMVKSSNRTKRPC